ncbi:MULTISPECIES: DUF2788 domain-containing protein [Iodobacter]|uniref:Protein of uncharacterized function (DUF2788) n=1 Tax=Iodobacter fluviatilis TaxID=537 RepID=A0A377Q5G6_9NEIS|nr:MULTISPECIES: DUF2788 domain-containing protein [Iodobacter]TCU89116.1 uncharacterized protein DUF2788 [Iodobacter fluviatilis]STQ90484.1 Protein of uncharacterised function (DUF2788) [Iodobacter fluviatilis]
MLEAFKNISEETFTTLSVSILCTGLIIYMGFIIYRLAADSKAGRYGSLVLFFTLGFGVFGFIVKTVLTEIIQK